MAVSIAYSPNDHYGPLLTQHIRTILESGLLLDEDYEVLLNASSFKIYPTKSTSYPLGSITTIITCLGSVAIAWKYHWPVAVIPTLGTTLILLCLKRIRAIKIRRQEAIVDCIVKSFNKLRKLNMAIIRYLQIRQKCDSTKGKEALLIYNDNVQEFVHYFVKNNKAYFKSCLNQLAFLVDVAPELIEDYESLKDINYELVLTSNITIDNYELTTAKVQDIFTFLSSKFLNYLGLTFSKHLKNINARELEVLLDVKLPCIKESLNLLWASVQKEFNNLRYCTSKKLEIDSISRSSLTRQLSGKLQQTLMGAVNNLSIIMEKSRVVLGKVGDTEGDRDIKNLESALGDLRDHAFATYESLDVLCKLYGILSGAKESHEKIKFAKDPKDSDSNTAAQVNYDDSSEALEENYELFIPETDEEVKVSEPKNRYEDQSGMYLNLMLKELRQSLKQHERFIAARSKRGIEDDEDDDKLQNISKPPIPKFDLKAFSTEATKKEVSIDKMGEKLPPVPLPRASKLPHPPQPPPLPAQVIFDKSQERNNGNEPKRSLFENINALSSQLQGKEDVFGDDCCSDSD